MPTGTRDSEPHAAESSARPPPSPWAPFRHAAFTVMWVATVVSNVGTWMYNAASGWLMTSLTSDPLVVSLVQAATSLPMCLLALPAGALADIVDRRRLLITVQVATSAIATVFAAFVALAWVTPAVLLLFTLLIGVGSVLIAPAWQAIVPQLVPKPALSPAITANSVGFNISRAVGPALGGVIIGILGIAAPFWLNAVSNIGVIAALLWWHPPAGSRGRLPAEHLWKAMISGVRYSRHNPHLAATMVRAVGFFVSAMAYWALLPLVARDQLRGGPGLYGILLGAIGAGAVAGAFLLPGLKVRRGPDRLVAGGTLGTAAALVAFGLARDSTAGIIASLIAGGSWIAVLASLNVSAQVALPEWVRGRGLAVYLTVMFGAMTLGSTIWGKAGTIVGLPATHFAAAACALAAIPLTWRWKLQTGAGADLTPSMHWPAPITAHDVEPDRGPVLVTVEYRIDPGGRAPFFAALDRLARERRRDGAYAWGVFEDAADEGRFIETFLVNSWLEHLRQHERVTNSDRLLQDTVHRFQVDGTPRVTHWIAAEPARGATRQTST